jgi:hypothetical protein
LECGGSTPLSFFLCNHGGNCYNVEGVGIQKRKKAASSRRSPKKKPKRQSKALAGSPWGLLPTAPTDPDVPD